jgi:flagellar biosynthesis component FlhA
MFSNFLKKNKNYLDSKSKYGLLHNVYLLYLIFFIALADIFYILQVKDFYAATVFIGVGILTSFVSKNMIVILCISMISAHIFKYGSKEGFESESMENEDQQSETEEPLEEEEEEEEPLEEEEVMTEEQEKTVTPEKINELLENQSNILEKMQEYKPLINSIESISKNLGFSSSE